MSDISRPKNNKNLSKIKSSIFDRTLSVAKIGLNAGFKYAAQKATGSLTGERYDQFITD